MEFWKMQGAGNDFIVVNNMEEKIELDVLPEMAKRLCRRQLSIGADALMLADHPEKNGDLQMRFYNADGTIAEMCGNGVRCLARFSFENGLAGEDMTIETVAGDIPCNRIDKRTYKTELNKISTFKENIEINVNDKTYSVNYVELGNPGIPHCVVELYDLDDIDKEDLKKLGRKIRYNDTFPKGVNVNFYKFENDKIKMITYERGVEDFTLACGTGAGSTAFSVWCGRNLQKDKIDVEVPGGNLILEFQCVNDDHTRIFITGDTNIVSKGQVTDEDYCNI